jgi:hypothetical protein
MLTVAVDIGKKSPKTRAAGGGRIFAGIDRAETLRDVPNTPRRQHLA